MATRKRARIGAVDTPSFNHQSSIVSNASASNKRLNGGLLKQPRAATSPRDNDAEMENGDSEAIV